MSIASIHNQLASLDREIQQLTQQLHSIDSRLISKRKEISTLLEKMSREKDLKRAAALHKEMIRKEEDASRIEKEKSSKQKNIQDKEKKKNDLIVQLGKEEAKEREKTKKEHQALLKLQQDITREVNRNTSLLKNRTSIVNSKVESQGYDVFVSHASEDKEFVNQFVLALKAKELKVWYDSSIMKVGMSLRRAIDEGLKNSKFGIVVLSPNFFKKEWPQKELDALFSKESEGDDVILPLWHQITKDELKRHSPLLVDKIALNTSLFTVDELAEKISEVVRPG